MDFANIMNEVVQHFTAKCGSTVAISLAENEREIGAIGV